MVFGLSKRHVASWSAMTIIAVWVLRQKGAQSREGLLRLIAQTLCDVPYQEEEDGL